MKVLMIHNKYKIAGGEDLQALEDFSLLKEKGIDAYYYYVSNEDIATKSTPKLAINAIWSSKYYHEILNKIKKEKFDIIHVHNFLPILSPSIFHAAKKANAKTILSVHNYRLICPNALMFINNKICDDCTNKTIPYPALFKKCYRDSYLATTAAVATSSVHNSINTWKNKIDGFICVSEFVKKQLLASKFQESKIHVKHNYISSTKSPNFKPEDYYIFVGRISIEKGINLLLNTFISNQKKLVLIGEGPLEEKVINAAKNNSNITYLGKLSKEDAYEKISKAKALIIPSVWHEPFGRTIVEAFAHGTPVLGSSLGGITELIKNNINGLLFDPSNQLYLENAIIDFENISNPIELRKNTYNYYLKNFTPDINYKNTIDIYNKTLNK